MTESIDDDELDLFRQELAGVVPLEKNTVDPVRRRHAPIPGQRLADDAKVLQELESVDPYRDDNETGEELWFTRPGLQQRLLKRLRRGQFSISSELDLHGLTVSEAHAALGEFLTSMRVQGVRGVRIIHGKGLRSPGGRPVLKGKLDRWLRQRDEVIAFCSARPEDGGTGAVYVLLRA